MKSAWPGVSIRLTLCGNVDGEIESKDVGIGGSFVPGSCGGQWKVIAAD